MSAWTREQTDADVEAARDLAGRMLATVEDENDRVVMMAGALVGACAAQSLAVIKPWGNAETWAVMSALANDLVLAGNGPRSVDDDGYEGDIELG